VVGIIAAIVEGFWDLDFVVVILALLFSLGRFSLQEDKHICELDSKKTVILTPLLTPSAIKSIWRPLTDPASIAVFCVSK